MIKELTVEPTGTKVDESDWLVVVWDDGKVVPDLKPIIVAMDPDEAKTSCGV